MRKIRITQFLLPLLVMLMTSVMLVGCKDENGFLEVPYLEVESTFSTALGEGDGFILSIRSNVAWTVKAEDGSGAEVDWIKFIENSGEGDADIIGVVLQGSRADERSCNFVVTSLEGSQIVKVPFVQEKFVPVLQVMSLSSIITTASRMTPSESQPMLDFRIIEMIVTGVPENNLPDDYVYLTDDGTCFVRAIVPDAGALKVGDKIQCETTGGTLTLEQNGGVTMDITTPIVLLSSGNDVPVAHIQASALQRYENALIKVSACQVQDGSLGKNWSGTTAMVTDDADQVKFDVVVESNASFAETAVPSENGTIAGIVVDGKLRPRYESDITLSVNSRNSYREPYIIDPICAFYKIGSAKNTFSNGKASGATKFTFSAAEGYSVEGASFEKVVGSANQLTLNVAVNTPFNSCCTMRQWHLDGTYMMYTLPVNQKVYGDLEFSFSISCGAAGVFDDRIWEVFWSTDGTTWRKPDGVYGAANQRPGSGDAGKFAFAGTDLAVNRMVVEFNIPENEAVSDGNLYFKMVPPAVDASYSAKTLRVNAGFFLSSATPFDDNLGYHNIVAQEHFNEALNGVNPVVGVPVYYLAYTSNKVDYVGQCQVTGTNVKYRGCVLLSAASGENYISTPALAGLTATDDVILTFKAAPYVDSSAKALAISANRITVACEGGGSAGEIVWDNSDFASDPYRWHTATVKISGATSTTRVKIGNLSSDISNASFYIDDIVISK